MAGAYLIGQVVGVGNVALAITSPVNVPVGDTILLISARSCNYVLSGDPTLEYGQATDDAGNVYTSGYLSFEPAGYPIPSIPTLGDTNLTDINLQYCFSAGLSIGQNINLAPNPGNNAHVTSSGMIAIGIPAASSGTNYLPDVEHVGAPVTNSNVFLNCPDPFPSSVNTVVAWAMVQDDVFPPTHSPIDDGYNQLGGINIAPASLTLRAYQLVYPSEPVPSPATFFTWSVPNLAISGANVLSGPGPTNLFLNLSPTSAAQSIACRREYCVYPWFG